MSDRLYCTLAELIADLELPGVKDESQLLRHVRAASDFIDRRLGWFIPATEARRFAGNGEIDLFVDPLLAATAVVNNGTTITTANYLLYPRNRLWSNGPYNRIAVDPDATQLSYWYFDRDAVAITGRWGKYEESISTGATVANTTQITSSGTSLLASDGSKISTGMVLLIESEQLLVEATGAATDSTTNTAEALDASEEAVDLVSGAAVNAGEIIRVEFEQMKVIEVQTNTIYVVRGWNGTARATHVTASDVFVFRSFVVKRGVNGTVAAAHLNSVAISRYIPPYDVNGLCRQLAALEFQMAKTGYSGRAGNAELGETFYFKKYPSEIKEIQRNYRVVSL